MDATPFPSVIVAVAASAALVSSLALLPSVGAAAEVDRHAAGHVYVLDNNLSGPNSITVFAPRDR